MADKKICPLTYTTEKGAYDQEVSDFGCYCKEAKCAWWNYETGECAILAISRFGTGTFELSAKERQTWKQIERF